MPDFTSALYLGFAHPSASLPPWEALTLGRPAALAESAGGRALAQELTRLIGGEAGLLYPSTLHLFRDLFQVAAPKGTLILFDGASYPIARWGADGAAVNGIPIETFPHRDLIALERRVRQARRAGQRPLIVVDGLCPSCGRPAQLPALARLAADAGGRLVIDDTQAIGVLGREPSPIAPLGIGGGGTLAWYGLRSQATIVGASLAKAFGAPFAIVSGASTIMKQLAREGQTRIHTSAASAADVAAGQNAVTINRAQGEGRRARVVRLVEQLRKELEKLGLQSRSELPIPVQAIAMPSLRVAKAVLASLDESCIYGLVTRSCLGGLPSLTLLITARHTTANISRAAAGLACAMDAASRAYHQRVEAA
ncbi:aminotransferase class I/II-fold pyridoxal phosphate-dependent enzyme [Bradyrhizobium japonicum]|uniref:aminotransferase class I/II-fold pyridoxal phosphate-dependent enzyme n=1 Tax=Bradyrhizobium japonicum TaxID=375 RepID=UPI001BA445CF|nr:aminotransferase class I/II-fold pyridoxal phosphate-dependent enzyme [Bradyrhizobium japonicum]MBR0916248.1 pyridoxal phosphate-dependent aminotransferase family protein [Bradyrhizobium japonicum]